MTKPSRLLGAWVTVTAFLPSGVNVTRHWIDVPTHRLWNGADVRFAAPDTFGRFAEPETPDFGGSSGSARLVPLVSAAAVSTIGASSGLVPRFPRST